MTMYLKNDTHDVTASKIAALEKLKNELVGCFHRICLEKL